jgi:hypothetical protein
VAVGITGVVNARSRSWLFGVVPAQRAELPRLVADEVRRAPGHDDERTSWAAAAPVVLAIAVPRALLRRATAAAGPRR